MNIHPNGVGAWITTDPSISDMVEVDIVLNGDPIKNFVTDTPVNGDDYGPAINQADSVIREAGYRRTEDWTATSNGFVAALTSDERNDAIIELLDNYQGDNVWEDMIYQLPDFDGEATDALYDSSHSDIGQRNTFVANNVVFEQDSRGWRCLDISDYRD